MTWARRIPLFLLCLLAPDARAVIPFTLPWNDSTPTLTDLSVYLDKPAGKYGFVFADPQGHFATTNGRIRFWGTNTTYGSNFPATQADAQAVAGRLAKYGVNMVRIHHADAEAVGTWGNGWWTTASEAQPDRTIDAGQLLKFDYFVSQLKASGVYVNINTVVSRPFFPGTDLNADIMQVGWKTRGLIPMFDAKALALQKDFTRDLLTHTNAYTGNRYVDEPAVGMVEINNENGLVSGYTLCMLDSLPPSYLGELRSQWNLWLKAKYGTHAAMLAAGFAFNQALGAEILTNWDFGTGALPPWSLGVQGAAAAVPSVIIGGGPAGSNQELNTITNPGSNSWEIQLTQAGFGVTAGQPYTVSFYAKASVARDVIVSIAMNHSPWGTLGLYQTVPLTTSYQLFTFSFVATATDANARISFDMGAQAGNVYLAQVSFKSGGTFGLVAGENLDTNSMLYIPCSSHCTTSPETVTDRTVTARRDFERFLWDTERAYWLDMYAYIKTTLGYKGLVTSTAGWFGTANLMADMDFVDTHAYWNHPTFPGIPWSATDWYQYNKAMVNNPAGAGPGNAGWRTYGKPVTMTEYNHPAPLTFEAECFPLISAYGSLQDFDGLFPFSYAGTNSNWNSQRIDGYFDIQQNPVKMASFVPAAAAFLRGDIAPGTSVMVASMSQDAEINGAADSGGWIPGSGSVGIDDKVALVTRIALATGKTPVVPGGALAPGSVNVSGNVLRSDTGQLVWDTSTAGKGFVTVDSPRSKWIVGYGGGKTITLSGFQFQPGMGLQGGYNVVALTAMDGMVALSQAREIVLTALGAQRNTGQGFYTYPSTPIAWPPPEGTQLTSRNDWGSSPALVEGVPASMTLPFPPANVRVWALSNTGARGAAVTVNNSGGKAQFAISEANAALWYEIQVDHAVLDARLVAFPNVNTGSNFRITLTVTNTGTAQATGVTASPFVVSGTGGVSYVAGPWPAMPVTLAAGASITFTWTYTGTLPGIEYFTATVYALDSVSAGGISTTPIVSNGEQILDPVTFAPSIKVDHFGYRLNDQKIGVVNANPGATAEVHRASDG